MILEERSQNVAVPQLEQRSSWRPRFSIREMPRALLWWPSRRQVEDQANQRTLVGNIPEPKRSCWTSVCMWDKARGFVYGTSSAYVEGLVDDFWSHSGTGSECFGGELSVGSGALTERVGYPGCPASLTPQPSHPALGNMPLPSLQMWYAGKCARYTTFFPKITGHDDFPIFDNCSHRFILPKVTGNDDVPVFVQYCSAISKFCDT